MTKLQDGYLTTFDVIMCYCVYSDLATYKKLFTQCCPKFISPVAPDYDALPDNYNYKVRQIPRHKNETWFENETKSILFYRHPLTINVTFS